MARLTDAQKRYFQRLAGSFAILSVNAGTPDIQQLFKQNGILEGGVRIAAFDSSTSQDVLNVEVITTRGPYAKRLTFKE